LWPAGLQQLKAAVEADEWRSLPSTNPPDLLGGDDLDAALS
jgi:hypothetical protein